MDNKYLILPLMLITLTITAASCDNRVWHIETVDTGARIVFYSGIAVDSDNNPHLIYNDSNNSTAYPQSTEVKYAYKNEAGWHLETIDNENPVHGHSAIAVDAHNSPHVSYKMFQNMSDYYNYTEYIHDVKYAYRDTAGWHIETVVDDEGVGDYYFMGFDWDTSLALDSFERPRISYYYYVCPWPCSRSGPNSLKYIYKDLTSWHSEEVDSGRDDVLDYVGEYNSIALDSGNNVHISYSIQYYYEPEINSESLNYAYLDTSGWHKEVVDSGRGIGAYNAIALDANSNPHISYSDAANKILKYAYKDAAGWHIKTVDTNGEVGKYTTIVLDSKGNPHISYYDGGNKALKYAVKNASEWHTTSPDTEGVGKYTAIAIDSNDNPHISYYDEQNKALKYAVLQ
jgi:hypothetical protein